MLKFLEIKKDIANGFTYFEYEGTWKGYEYCIIMDVHADNVIFSFVDDDIQAVFSLDINTFLDIKWYKDYVNFINQAIHYNSVEININY